MLAWQPPLNEGGRTDTLYRVVCDACGSHVSYYPPPMADVRSFRRPLYHKPEYLFIHLLMFFYGIIYCKNMNTFSSILFQYTLKQHQINHTAACNTTKWITLHQSITAGRPPSHTQPPQDWLTNTVSCTTTGEVQCHAGDHQRPQPCHHLPLPSVCREWGVQAGPRGTVLGHHRHHRGIR